MDVSLKHLKVLRDASGAPLNPRGDVGDTTDLQTALREAGQIDPIVVGPADDKGFYPIIHGHRRYAALLAMKAKTAKIFVDEQVDIANENDIRKKMLATTASVKVKPSARGAYIRGCMAREVDPWPLERAATVMGMAPAEARLYVRLAELQETEPQFVARVDNGEISWTAFKNRLAKAPKAVREQVTRAEKPTRDVIETIVKKATKPGENVDQIPGLRGEEVIKGLNEARRSIQRAVSVLDEAHEAVRERIEILLDDIAHDLGVAREREVLA